MGRIGEQHKKHHGQGKGDHNKEENRHPLVGFRVGANGTLLENSI